MWRGLGVSVAGRRYEMQDYILVSARKTNLLHRGRDKTHSPDHNHQDYALEDGEARDERLHGVTKD